MREEAAEEVREDAERGLPGRRACGAPGKSGRCGCTGACPSSLARAPNPLSETGRSNELPIVSSLDLACSRGHATNSLLYREHWFGTCTVVSSRGMRDAPQVRLAEVSFLLWAPARSTEWPSARWPTLWLKLLDRAVPGPFVRATIKPLDWKDLRRVSLFFKGNPISAALCVVALSRTFGQLWNQCHMLGDGVGGQEGAVLAFVFADDMDFLGRGS